MKRTVLLILIYSLCVIAALSQETGTPSPNAVVHVATALNHLTVLEFHEPVTMAAAGSSDFQIEREANKVFVKPVKSGASTDLFVWTASRRFAYELEITQEVKEMSFAIDTAQPAARPGSEAGCGDRYGSICRRRADPCAHGSRGDQAKKYAQNERPGHRACGTGVSHEEHSLYPLHDREQQRPFLSCEYATGIRATDRRLAHSARKPRAHAARPGHARRTRRYEGTRPACRSRRG